ncbi:unnamed protein product [Choristocarpus tenellus]
MAMFAGGNMRTCYYRPGYDISLPLPPSGKGNLDIYQETASPDRKYFLTFKGSFYPTGSGHLDRTAALLLGEIATGDADVVILLRCKGNNCGGYEHLRPLFNSYKFNDLMNTTFALVPGGRSPATYRLAEALSAGAIPVFLQVDFVAPFMEQIPWSQFSFSFSPDDVQNIFPTLRAVLPQQLMEMQV